MAMVERRAPRRPGGEVSYRVRYRDPAGVARSKTFRKVSQANVFAATVEADKARGTYVDHTLGRITLGEYAEQWLAMQTFGESTRETTAHRIRGHIVPVLGTTPLAALRTSQVQSWLRAKQQQLAPRTVRTLFATLSSVLSSAVDDERIAKNPCRAGSLRLPKVDDRRIVPWTEPQVSALQQALPDRYRVALTLATGLGLRQGEVFGLAVQDVDFLRGTVHVRRQVAIIHSRLVFALPKGRKPRQVPLPESVARQLSAHLQAFPAGTVVLPWETPEGRPEVAKLVLTSREAGALNRNYVNRSVWKPALRRAGMPDGREQGMHAGRHFYASVQLEAGTSVRALADYLGHSDPGFTLRTYTHLMPAAEGKAKRAVDGVFERIEEAARDALCGPDVAPSAV